MLASEDLTRSYAADTTSVNNGNLTIVAWSRDGHSLYAAGHYAVPGWFPIRRWDAGGKGMLVEWQAATNTVVDLRPLADGKLTIGASDPLVAVLDAHGKVRWQQRGATADFRDQQWVDLLCKGTFVNDWTCFLAPHNVISP